MGEKYKPKNPKKEFLVEDPNKFEPNYVRSRKRKLAGQPESGTTQNDRKRDKH